MASRRRDDLKTNCSCMEGSYGKIRNGNNIACPYWHISASAELNRNLSNEIQELEEKHKKEQTKLAGATAEENTAVEEAELKSAERKKCESHLLHLEEFGING